MSTEKEKGASPDQAAPQANDRADSAAPEAPRALFHPLNWRPERPAIARKRGQWGSASVHLLAWLSEVAR